jgi:WD40 repeat protein
MLRRHKGGITALAFSRDGRFLVSTSLDADARVWSVATGRHLHRLHGHFGLVRSAEFSPDGRWIVTAGPATAGLWAASTGKFLAFLRGHRGALRTAVFGPDSRTILTSGDDGTVRTYHCEVCGTLAQLVRLAEARLAETKSR